MRKIRLTAVLLAVVCAAAAFPVSSRAYPDKPVQDYNPLGVKLTVKNIPPQTQHNGAEVIKVDGIEGWADTAGTVIGTGIQFADAGMDSFIKNYQGSATLMDNALTGSHVIKAAGAMATALDTSAYIYQIQDVANQPFASHPSMQHIYDSMAGISLGSGWAGTLGVEPAGWIGWGVGFTKDMMGNSASAINGILDFAEEHPFITAVSLPGSDAVSIYIRNVEALDAVSDGINKGTTSLFYNLFYADSELPEWDYNEYFIKLYSDRANLYAQMVKEGREKEFEWLRDWLLQNNPYKGHVRLPQLVTAKKPNIYLYPENETDLKLSFENAKGITASIPCYSDSWTITAMPDGTIIDSDGKKYGYLFYECLTNRNIFDKDCGFVVRAASRDEDIRCILEKYKFNEQEINDFIEYWREYLDEGTDYVMYPAETEVVDEAMPIETSAEIDSRYRIWFGFSRDIPDDVREPEITPIVRNGFTMVEWGGAVIG